MSELAHLTLAQKLEIVTNVAAIDVTMSEDDITQAATGFVEPHNPGSARHLNLLRHLLRETLNLKWGAILRAKGDVLVTLSKDCIPILQQQLGGDDTVTAEAEPPPAKTPVTKPKDPPPATTPPPVKPEAPTMDPDAEEPGEEVEPAKQKKNPRRRTKPSAPEDTDSDNNPAPKAKAKPKPKTAEVATAAVDPGFELGTWDGVLIRMEAIEKSQKALSAKLDQVLDLLKDSHNDLGEHIRQEVRDLSKRVDKLYHEQITLLEDADYVPKRTLDD
ncbi:MAG: hypothetical protein KDB07_06215 [Planctomycetes bacterium]|nr:hypothetical protein [Planctomycetota bacterium]